LPPDHPHATTIQKAITLLEDIAQAVDQAYNKQKQNLEFTEVINEFFDSQVCSHTHTHAHTHNGAYLEYVMILMCIIDLVRH
jgi:hypothetical protein